MAETTKYYCSFCRQQISSQSPEQFDQHKAVCAESILHQSENAETLCKIMQIQKELYGYSQSNQEQRKPFEPDTDEEVEQGRNTHRPAKMYSEEKRRPKQRVETGSLLSGRNNDGAMYQRQQQRIRRKPHFDQRESAFCDRRLDLSRLNDKRSIGIYDELENAPFKQQRSGAGMDSSYGAYDKFERMFGQFSPEFLQRSRRLPPRGSSVHSEGDSTFGMFPARAAHRPVANMRPRSFNEWGDSLDKRSMQAKQRSRAIAWRSRNHEESDSDFEAPHGCVHDESNSGSEELSTEGEQSPRGRIREESSSDYEKSPTAMHRRIRGIQLRSVPQKESDSDFEAPPMEGRPRLRAVSSHPMMHGELRSALKKRPEIDERKLRYKRQAPVGVRGDWCPHLDGI